jgi:hypothetical protein
MTSVSETAVGRVVRPEAVRCVLLVSQKEEGNLSQEPDNVSARFEFTKIGTTMFNGYQDYCRLPRLA